MRVRPTSLSVWLGLAVVATVLVVRVASQGARPAPLVVAKFEIVSPDQLKWTDPPAGAARGTPSVEPGSPLRYALIHGDPLKPGAPFAFRYRCSSGYKAAPHWHPVDENIVVLHGTFSVGTGDKFDTASMQDIPTGGYGFVPARMNHFAACKGETDFLVYGIGPRLNNWLPGSSGGALGAGGKPFER